MPDGPVFYISWKINKTLKDFEAPLCMELHALPVFYGLPLTSFLRQKDMQIS